ncbi:MAG: PEGA domain-containing protein [Vicinamibacteria bacterium]|nr:PEGA domain-containing protein [Vicinamibacteria bacterium]
MAAALAAGVQGITPYLAQEYVAGEALDAVLRQFGPPPLAETLTTLRRVADALDRAAGDGIHHGTLHPRDILIAEGGDARVIDLGVAQALMRSGLRVPVRRPYSAPERVADKAWSGPADIYSLGAIAYELITGRRLSGPGRPEVQAPGISPAAAAGLSEVLARALDEDPSARYPSAADLVDALAPLLPTGRRSTRRKIQPTADLPLPLDVAEPTLAMEPFDPGQDLTDLVHRAPPSVPGSPMIDDLPVSADEPAPRFASLDDEPDAPELTATGEVDHAGPAVPPHVATPQRRRLLPLVMALVVGVAAGFGWGYWTAFRTIDRMGPEGPATAAAVAPLTPSVRVDEPEVIGERNLPSPAARPATPAAAPAEPRRATRLPPGRLVVRSTPPGANVRVDGRVRGRTPLVLRDMPLRVVRVTIEREGFKADERRVALSAAQPTVTVDARLSANAPPAPEATTGVLVIESRPTGATVFVDGQRIGTTPMSLPDSSRGTHRIRLEMAGFSPWVTTADVQAGARTRVAASLERGTPK